MANNNDLSNEQLVGMLKTMKKIRFFEERCKSLFKQNFIYGALHLYIGEEAIATGACAALNKDDYILSTHRGHGHDIAKGAELKYMMAELMGRKTGYSGGHGGSMHIFCEELGILGGNGIVGGGIPIALGAAYSAKYRKSGQVTIGFFGDGAANNGTFHESLHMAALWQAPLVYICESNCVAATTLTERVTSTKDIAPRAAGYGMPFEIVDGNDVEAVYAVTAKAVENARAGKGPTLIEAKTCRMEPHCMVLQENRPDEHFEEWDGTDPIDTFRDKLIEQKIIDVAGVETMIQSIVKELDEAEKFAVESEWPSIDELHANFYA